MLFCDWLNQQLVITRIITGSHALLWLAEPAASHHYNYYRNHALLWLAEPAASHHDNYYWKPCSSVIGWTSSYSSLQLLLEAMLFCDWLNQQLVITRIITGNHALLWLAEPTASHHYNYYMNHALLWLTEPAASHHDNHYWKSSHLYKRHSLYFTDEWNYASRNISQYITCEWY